MRVNVGDTFIGGNDQKVTIIKADNEKGVILFLFEKSGEPFVVTNDFKFENEYICWSGSRYRNDIESAVATFQELIS